MASRLPNPPSAGGFNGFGGASGFFASGALADSTRFALAQLIAENGIALMNPNAAAPLSNSLLFIKMSFREGCLLQNAKSLGFVLLCITPRVKF
jgi:hypothetical protein